MLEFVLFSPSQEYFTSEYCFALLSTLLRSFGATKVRQFIELFNIQHSSSLRQGTAFVAELLRRSRPSAGRHSSFIVSSSPSYKPENPIAGWRSYLKAWVSKLSKAYKLQLYLPRVAWRFLDTPYLQTEGFQSVMPHRSMRSKWMFLILMAS